MTKGERSAPARDGSTGTRIRSRGDSSTFERPVKWRRILGELLAGRSLNRFEAERIGDHCLHSTIATIQRKGVAVLRCTESVPGYRGCPAAVCRYTIDRQSENMERARALLGESAGPEDANTASRSRESAGNMDERVQGLDRAGAQP